MISKEKAVFSEDNRTYDTGATCDKSNAAEETNIYVAEPTSPIVAADRVILGRGTSREEERVVDSVAADDYITLTVATTYNHTIDVETTTDGESAPDGENKILTVTATTDFLAGEEVLVDSGETHEHTYTIASVQAGVSLTMTEVLAFTHDTDEAVAQTGVGEIVEVIMLTESTAIDKSHCKRMAITLPSTWQTAEITFLGCNTPDGTFTQIVKATNIAEIAIASVGASKTIGMDGVVMQALEAVPFIKLRSGTLTTPIDQKTGKIIDIMLMR